MLLGTGVFSSASGTCFLLWELEVGLCKAPCGQQGFSSVYTVVFWRVEACGWVVGPLLFPSRREGTRLLSQQSRSLLWFSCPGSALAS